jgi:hypothetical protein
MLTVQRYSPAVLTMVLFLDVVQRYAGYSDTLSILPLSISFKLQVNPLGIQTTGPALL